MFFWNSLAFLIIQQMLAIWSLVPLPFLNPAWTSVSSSLCPSLHEMLPCISNFLEEISSLSHSIVFLYFFALITEKGFLISPCYSLELCLQVGISFLFSFAFLFYSFLAVCKASSDIHFAFLHFFFLGMVLITDSCTMSWTFIHSSSDTIYQI